MVGPAFSARLANRMTSLVPSQPSVTASATVSHTVTASAQPQPQPAHRPQPTAHSPQPTAHRTHHTSHSTQHTAHVNSPKYTAGSAPSQHPPGPAEIELLDLAGELDRPVLAQRLLLRGGLKWVRAHRHRHSTQHTAHRHTGTAHAHTPHITSHSTQTQHTDTAHRPTRTDQRAKRRGGAMWITHGCTRPGVLAVAGGSVGGSERGESGGK